MSVALAEQPPTYHYDVASSFAFQDAHEVRKSFNVLASVNMMRADLAEIGVIRPETKERVRDEELSLLSEGVDRAACTDFPLKRIGTDLMYLKRGEWLSYTAMLLEGREVAHSEAASDHRKQFLADDSIADLAHGLAMRNLAPGEQHVWVSPYRHDIEALYGKDFMTKCGRFPDRQMGFIYRAVCNQDGDIILQSHTVDRSDSDAFAAVMTHADTDQTVDIDALVDTYDDALEAKHGQKYFAGRLETERRENAWQTILAQEDLIRYFLNGLETIARSSAQGNTLEMMTKEHMYGVWAAFKNRIGGKSMPPPPRADQEMPIGTQVFFEQARLRHEVQQAFKQFANEGRVMVGCGGSIQVLEGKEDILNADPSDVFSSIFGSERKGKEEDCEFISKTCPKCGDKNARTKCTKGKYIHIPKGCSS